MDSFKRCNEEKLPEKECFYSSVKHGTTGDNAKNLDGHISNEDYLTCKKVWNEFNMRNMGNYHDHYLKKDVLLLADIFEKFIDTHLKFCKLDPCHYFSSPGLSWDTMLKIIGVKLGKTSVTEMYLFIEKGLRGGISSIAKRYSKINNKYMKNYDLTKLIIFVICLDMNNLYGCGMSDYLPYSVFMWLKNVDKLDVISVGEKSPIGYILKVDLEYPDELHKLHNDYPLAPEKLAIHYDMLSDYCKKIADEYGIKIADVKKLIPNLDNKTNYVLQYRNLDLYLSLGIKLTKIHRVLKLNNLTG